MKPFLFVCLLFAPFLVQAQTTSNSTPAYLRYPTVPPFAFTTPSGKVFTNKDLKKHTPLMVILFSVDCEHCQHETKELVDNIGRFKGAQIIMVTPFRHDAMTAFYNGYGIGRHQNIISMGTDSTRRLNMFYQMHFWPGIYIYNKKNQLVYHHEGTTKIDTLVHYLKNG